MVTPITAGIWGEGYYTFRNLNLKISVATVFLKYYLAKAVDMESTFVLVVLPRTAS